MERTMNEIIKEYEENIKEVKAKFKELEAEKKQLIEQYKTEKDESKISNLKLLMQKSEVKYKQLYAVIKEMNNKLKKKTII